MRPELATGTAPARPATASERPSPGPAPRLQASRIVVACDDPMLSDTLDRILRAHAEELAPEGMEIRRVHDGLTCLQDIQLTRPSLLVLHARLPKLTVEEILQAWEAAQPGDAIPVIVLSSGFGSDVPPGMPGAVVLRLPFRNDELVAIASRALQGERAARG